MLLRTVFLVAFLALLAETFVHGAGALARVALQHRELAATRAAFSAAVAAAQQSSARAISIGQSPQLALPSPFATCYEATSTGCTIAVTTTISTPTPAAQPSPAACPQTACTIYLQANSAVAESRAAYHVSTTVTAANGDVLIGRSGDIAFRTFSSAPYASLVGSLDATLDALENGATGDDGGNASAAGTLITVEYVPSGAASSPIPGNVWQAQDEHPVTNAPAWDR